MSAALENSGNPYLSGKEAASTVGLDGNNNFPDDPTSPAAVGSDNMSLPGIHHELDHCHPRLEVEPQENAEWSSASPASSQHGTDFPVEDTQHRESMGAGIYTFLFPRSIPDVMFWRFKESECSWGIEGVGIFVN